MYTREQNKIDSELLNHKLEELKKNIKNQKDKEKFGKYRTFSDPTVKSLEELKDNEQEHYNFILLMLTNIIDYNEYLKETPYSIRIAIDIESTILYDNWLDLTNLDLTKEERVGLILGEQNNKNYNEYYQNFYKLRITFLLNADSELFVMNKNLSNFIDTFNVYLSFMKLYQLAKELDMLDLVEFNEKDVIGGNSYRVIFKSVDKKLVKNNINSQKQVD